MKIKFAHISDCHLGAWRKETLNQVGYEAFIKAIDKVIEENVDFVIIAGDLYDVSNPKVDVVDLATKQLKRLKDANIPVYGILGSHDFSPSKKSMIRPLLSAELFTNVCIPRYIDDADYPLKLDCLEDNKTSIKLCGMRARKRSLELNDYKQLDREYIEKQEGTKIFVLHTALNELKPLELKDMIGGSKNILPQNFLYYAGGHIHRTVPKQLKDQSIIIKKDVSIEKKVIYPGALYPTNFYELEQFGHGGFCIVSGEIPDGDLEVQYVPLKIKEVEELFINADNKTIEKVKERIDERITGGTFEDKIVAVRISGELTSGKPIEIKPDIIKTRVMEKGAYEVFVNKKYLTSKEYKAVKIDPGITNEEIENKLIHEHAQKSKVHNLSKGDIEDKTHEILVSLGRDRHEGETVNDYDKQMIENFYTILNIEMEDLE